MPNDILGTVKACAATMDNFAVLRRGWLKDLVTRCEQAEADLAALRQRHAAEVEQAFREGYDRDLYPVELAWRDSEARKGVARDQE